MPIPYVGGKTKYAKEILAVILPGNENRIYWEPFVGSASMLVHVPTFMHRFANDKNPYLIAMHEAVRSGWAPPQVVTEKEYLDIKQYPSKYPKELVGFVSIGCSFGAKMWGGYARNSKGTNYAAQSAKAVLDTFGALQRVSFVSMDYQELLIPDGSLVYCDPPYAGTTDYGDYTTQAGEFWRWCDKLVMRDCKVFVSGYRHNKKVGWDVVWSQEVKTVLNNSNGKVINWKKDRKECLFAPSPKYVEHLKANTLWKYYEEVERAS